MIRRTLIALLVLTFGVTSISTQNTYRAEIEEMARQLNLWRLSLGLGPLTYNPTLERMASVQADYVVGLPSWPGDVHAGRSGEDPRARSQFPEFAWPTYGHPQIMSVSEITALGSVQSGMTFWRGSEIHTRSATNPAYRQIGIAARQYGSDILFVVVLGGQPNVLPVLLDVEGGVMYLSTEKAEWSGDWIGEATDYRFLDAEQQILTDWMPWQRDIVLEDDLLEIASQAVFIQYRDADDKRTEYQLTNDPQWSSLPVPEPVDIIRTPTVTPTPDGFMASPTPTETAFPTAESIFVTNTPLPTATITPTVEPTRTPFPTFTPTVTAAPGSVMFMYTDNVFTLYNAGDSFVDLSGIFFQREDVNFTGTFWEEVSDVLNISALPPNTCLIIEPEDSLTYTYPAQCVEVFSIVEEPNPRYFWLGDFEVLINGQPITTCDGEADTCTLAVN